MGLTVLLLPKNVIQILPRGREVWGLFDKFFLSYHVQTYRNRDVIGFRFFD